MTAAPETNHDDLMDLASRWSYADLKRHQEVRVNGTDFVVMDIKEDTGTGLDAITFRNPDTNELTVGFAGTVSLTDWLNDAALLTQWDPAQYEAAEVYVREVEARFGTVGSVCGNSLGGGLAAYVAASNPSMTAVTVNPAPVPDSLAGVDAPNVHNYISRADVLHRLVVAGGLGDRIIGNQVPFDGTSMATDFIAANHIGSDRGDPSATPYDGSMAVPFSLFHTDRVVAAGQYGGLVDITVENLRMMVDGLRLQREDLLVVQEVELVGVEEELREYAAGLWLREEAGRLALRAAVEAAFDPVRRWVGGLSDEVEWVLRSPLISFPAPPGILHPAWRPVQNTLTDVVAALVVDLRGIADFAIQNAADAAWDGCQDTFSNESLALTNVLADQSRALQGDLGLVDTKWERFLAGASTVADAVEQADQEVAAAIAARSCPTDAVQASVGPWPAQVVQPLEEDTAKQFRQTYVDERQRIVGDLITQVGAALAASVGPISSRAAGLSLGLEALEIQLGIAQGVVRAAAKVASYDLVAWVTGISDDLDRFQQAVGDLYADFRSVSDDWQLTIAMIGETLDQLPEVVLGMSDYLEQSFFSDGQIETAYDSFLKCRNLVERSELAFGEARYQLDEHTASAIDALAGRAQNLARDLDTVGDSFTEMVA